MRELAHRVRIPSLVAALTLGGWSLLGGAAPTSAQLVQPGLERAISPEGEEGASRPAVAVARDGSAAVVWVDSTVQDRLVTSTFELQRFDPRGEPLGDPVEVASRTHRFGSANSGPSVAAGHDGSFLVVWRDEGIRARRVGAGGAAGDERLVAADEQATLEQFRPRVAANPQGGFVVVWLAGGFQSRIILLQRVDAAGSPVGPEWRVAEASEDTEPGPPRLSVGPAGGAVVIWSAQVRRGHFRSNEIHGRWFAPDGSPLGPPTGLATGGSDQTLDLVHLSDGDILIMWQGRADTEPAIRLFFHRFDASGRLLAERSMGLPNRSGFLQLTPVLAGAALLDFGSNRPGGPALLAQLLDASLDLLAEPVRISRFDFGATGATLASDGAAYGFAVWQGAGGLSGTTVYGRTLRIAAAGAVAFSEPTYRVPEGRGVARIPVRRIGFAEGAVSVEYRTEVDSAEPGEDYRPVQGSLSWSDGDLSERTIELPILQDPGFEGPEVVRLHLSDPNGGAVLGRLREAQVVIEDDDGRPRVGGAPVPLTAEQAACDRTRLEGVLDRMELLVPNGSKAAGVNLSLTVSGDFAGIAYTGNGPATAEHHLAFSTDPEVTTLLLNPERSQLPAVALARNPVNSDLVAPDDRDLLSLRLRPTAGSEEPPPAAFLAIDNVRGPDGSASQVKPGRGLAGLLAACHRDRLVERDVHILRVLSKIVRLDLEGAQRTRIAIHRAPEIDSYGIEAQALAADGRFLGTVVARLTVSYSADGALAGGELDLVPPCAGGGCTTLDRPGRLLLVRPAFTGELWTPTPYQVQIPAGTGPGSVAVDWGDLLGSTTWLRSR